MYLVTSHSCEAGVTHLQKSINSIKLHGSNLFLLMVLKAIDEAKWALTQCLSAEPLRFSRMYFPVDTCAFLKMFISVSSCLKDSLNTSRRKTGVQLRGFPLLSLHVIMCDGRLTWPPLPLPPPLPQREMCSSCREHQTGREWYREYSWAFAVEIRCRICRHAYWFSSQTDPESLFSKGFLWFDFYQGIRYFFEHSCFFRVSCWSQTWTWEHRWRASCCCHITPHSAAVCFGRNLSWTFRNGPHKSDPHAAAESLLVVRPLGSTAAEVWQLGASSCQTSEPHDQAALIQL